MTESCFSFLNRSVPFFSKEQVILKLGEESFIKIEAPFIDEISGLVMAKMLDKKEHGYINAKTQVCENIATLDVANISFETVVFNPKEMLGFFYLRSVGSYKFKHGVLQQNHSKYFRFE